MNRKIIFIAFVLLEMLIIVNAAKAALPTYSLNQTNSTIAGTWVNHSTYWTSDVGLSGYIFSFCNGTYPTSQTYNWTSTDQEAGTQRFNTTSNTTVNTYATGLISPKNNTNLTARPFLNPTYAYDNNLATRATANKSTNPATGNSSGFYNFTFNIPSVANITGIAINYSSNISTTYGFMLMEVKNNTQMSTAKFNQTLTTTRTNYTNGNSSYLWGLTWTPAIINNMTVNVTAYGNTNTKSQWLYEIWANVTYQNTTYNTEKNSSFVTYSGIDGNDYQNVDKVGAILTINTYNPSASNTTYNNNQKPDIEVGFYNGTAYVNNSICHINDTMGSGYLNMTAWNCSINKTDSDITSAWKYQANRSVIIRGFWLDGYNSTIYDEINVTGVYGYVDGWNNTVSSCSDSSANMTNDTWVSMTGTGKWSNVTKIVNSTVGATIKWCVYANDTSNNWNSTSCVNPFSYVTTTKQVNVFSPNISQQLAFNGTAPSSESYSRKTTNMLTLANPEGEVLNSNRKAIDDISMNSSTLKSAEFFKSTSGYFTTTGGISAAVARIFAKLSTGFIDLTDNIQRIFSTTKSLNNAVNLSEVSRRISSIVRNLTNSVDLTESLTRIFSPLRNAVNSLDVTDGIQAILTKIRAVGGSIDLSEVASRLASFTRKLASAVDLSDNMSRVLTPLRQLTNSINLNNVTGRISSVIRKLTSGINFTGFVAKVSSLGRNLTNSVSLGNVAQRTFSPLRQLTNALNLNGTMSRLVSFTKSITNTFRLTTATTSELITPLRDIVITVGIDLSDAVNRASSFTRSLVNVADLTDNIKAVATRIRQLTNGVDLTNSVQRIFSSLRQLGNAVDLTEVMTRVFKPLRQLTNSFDLTDSVSRLLKPVRQLANSINMKNSITRLSSFPRSLTNMIDLTDATQRIFSPMRKIVNSLNFSTTMARFGYLTRNLTSSINLTETIQKIFRPIRQMSNFIDLTETISRMGSFTKRLANAIDLSDTMNRISRNVRQMAGAVDLTDGMARVLKPLRQLTNGISLTGSIQKIFSQLRKVINSVNLSNAMIRFGYLTRNLTNSINLTNVIQEIFRPIRQISNSISISGGINKLLSFTRSLISSIDLTDAVMHIGSFTRKLSNSLTITSQAIRTTLQTYSRLVAESINVADTISKLLSFIRNITGSFSLNNIVTKPFLSTERLSTLSMTLGETGKRMQTFTKSFTEIINITNLTERIRHVPRLITEMLDFSEITSRLSLLQRITSLQFLVAANTLPHFKTVSATFSIHMPSVTQGEFAEFDFNVQNTGNLPINASTGIEIYNSSNSLIATINSTNSTFSAGQSKSIITFLNTINITADNYRAEGRVLFDGRSTINANGLFNVSSSANVQIGNYTNTSIDLQVETPTLITANTSTSTTANISITLNSTQKGAIAISEFSSVENQTIGGYAKLEKFIEITASPNITDNLKWYWLNISYTDAEVLSSGVTESNLRIWFYNETTENWQIESNSGVDISANYVWANVSHFSRFGIYSQIPAQPSVLSSHTVGSSVTGGAQIAIAPLPTAEIEFVEWSVLREVVAGQSILEGIKVKNKATDTLTNLHIEASGMPADWISIIPESLNLSPNESKAFNLIISVPKDADKGDYKLLITLKNSSVEDSNFMIIRVKDYAPVYNNPIVTRIVQLDYEINKTKIILDVINPVKNIPLVQVKEEIPKVLAQSVNEVEFNPYPDSIIAADPLVQWDLKDLKVNDSKTLSYLTKGILDEFTPYIYLPLKELTVVETKLPTGLHIVGVNIPALSAGKSNVGRVTLENTGNVEKKLEFSMQLPSGWKMEPEKIEASISPKEKREFKFSIIVPDSVESGDYIGTYILIWGEDTHIEEIVLHILTIPFYAKILIFIGSISIIIVVYVIYRSRKKERPIVYRLKKIVDRIREGK